MLDQYYSTRHYRGRWALRYMLSKLGVGLNDIVVCQAFTCTAVPEAISSLGAKPIFIDVADRSVNMCPASLQNTLSKLSRVKAVIVQYTYGSDHLIDDIFNVLNNYDIPVIEDCCHLPFSDYTLSKLGDRSYGKFFSFEWGKPIPIGIGGVALFSKKRCVVSLDDIEQVQLKVLNIVKLEMQYFAFKLLYKPSFYFTIKRAFRLLSRLGLLVGNHSPAVDPVNFSEYSLKINPRVLKRLNRSDLPCISNNIYSHSLSLRESISNLNLNVISSESSFLMRLPILVKSKRDALSKSAKLRLELSDWYSSPVDPFSSKECEKLGWDVSHCKNAKFLSDHIVTIPLSPLIDVNDIKKYSFIAVL